MLETFAYHNYAISGSVKSKIDPSVTHTEQSGFSCPRCRLVHAPLDHAEGVVCSGCGLAIVLYGNGLTCATEGEQELRKKMKLGPMAPPMKIRAVVLRTVLGGGKKLARTQRRPLLCLAPSGGGNHGKG